METLTDTFFNLILEEKEHEAADVLRQSPDTPEAEGLRGYAFYCGIDSPYADTDKAFEHFGLGAAGNDSLSLYYLGIMCERGETPDQCTGGERQKYDHCDAERFMVLCADGHGIMEEWACLWLGQYFYDSARGGDSGEAVGCFVRAADLGNEEAVEWLVQIYADCAEYEDYADVQTNMELFRWQEKAYENNPHDESYNYGRLLYGGIPGIPANLRLALKLYEEDFEFGHSQGARALALHYESEAGKTEDTGEAEKFAALADMWHERADRNAENDYEPEQIIEED